MTKAAPYRVQVLDTECDRSDFDCGIEALNRYFASQVTQDIRRRVASAFVAVDTNELMAGFYTLASASVPLSELPVALAKKLPRYPSVPVVRMGRLAIDQRHQGQGLGGALLADALTRCMRSEIAAYALLVDAKDEHAAKFYEHHGFVRLSRQALTLFLPLATAQKLMLPPSA